MRFPRLLFLIGILLVGNRTLGAGDAGLVTVISGSQVYFDSTKPQDNQTVRIDYLVPIVQWQKTPSWKMETEPVPLDAEGATEAAKRWIAAQPWADQFEGFDQVDLIRWGNSAKPDSLTGRWYYNVYPVWKETEDDKPSPQPTPTPAIQVDLRPTSLVVLFDGTVIGPTVSKLVTGKDKK